MMIVLFVRNLLKIEKIQSIVRKYRGKHLLLYRYCNIVDIQLYPAIRGNLEMEKKTLISSQTCPADFDTLNGHGLRS